MASSWFGTGSSSSRESPSTVTCHFCGQQYALQSRKGKSADRTVLSTIRGSWSSFQCLSCESWNLRDTKTGEFVEDAQIFQDASLNPGPSSRTGVESSVRDAVFCRDCLTNQNLQVQLLAGYLPTSIPPNEEASLMERLPAYQDSLAARYPLVCPNCQAKVESVIEERNWKAKARTVGGWLKKSAKLARGHAGTSISAAPRHGQHVWFWRTKGLAWRALYSSTVCACLVPSLPIRYTALPLGVSDIYQYRSARMASAITFTVCTLFASFWNPTYLQRQRRGETTRAVGTNRWLLLQGMLYLLRVGYALRLALSLSVDDKLAYAIAAAHLLTLLLRDRIIYVTGPRRARLREQHTTSRSVTKVSLAPSRTQRNPRTHDRRSNAHSAQPANSVFGKLSLGSAPPLPPAQRRNPFQLRDDRDVNVDDEQMDMDDEYHRAESMEWQAEEEAEDIVMADVQNQHPSSQEEIKLRPAVFNPSDDNWNNASLGAVRGLERLFEQGVSLDDVRMENPIRAGEADTARFSLGVVLGVVVLVIAGLAGVWYGRKAA